MIFILAIISPKLIILAIIIICLFILYCFKIKNIVELIVAHTTPSMCFGYMSSDMREAKVLFSY
jgi:hypothetical protein